MRDVRRGKAADWSSMCSTIDDLERFYAALIPPIIKPQLVPDQEALVERLLKSNHYTLYPPALTFQRRFWKAIITHIEEQHEVNSFTMNLALRSSKLE